MSADTPAASRCYASLLPQNTATPPRRHAAIATPPAARFSSLPPRRVICFAALFARCCRFRCCRAAESFARRAAARSARRAQQRARYLRRRARRGARAARSAADARRCAQQRASAAKAHDARSAAARYAEARARGGASSASATIFFRRQPAFCRFSHCRRFRASCRWLSRRCFRQLSATHYAMPIAEPISPNSRRHIIADYFRAFISPLLSMMPRATPLLPLITFWPPAPPRRTQRAAV